MAQLKGGPFRRQANLDVLIAEEDHQGLDQPETFKRFYDRIEERKVELREILDGAKADGRRVAGFGAPAKATTLMHFFGLGRDDLDYVVDDSKLKQNLFTPGYHIPVVPSSYLYDELTKPDDVLVLAWNFAEPIMSKHRKFASAGDRFIVPLPDVEVYCPQ